MANTPDNVVATLTSMPAYVEAFEASFDDGVSFDNMAKAIEAYEATLITPAPFDAYLNGDEAALSDEQKAGLQLFIDKGCTACHAGINVGGEGYFPFGLIEKPGADVLPEGDKGRFAVTETADDEYVFRAAPLRNIAVTAPYFHSGKVWGLDVAVQIMAESQLGESLTDDETTKIVAFLDSLTGELPEITTPILPAETATTPRPSAEILP
jgi:cytochrome c peroxidase